MRKPNTTANSVDYFRLPRDPSGGRSRIASCPRRERERNAVGPSEGFPQSADRRYLLRALDGMSVEGRSSRVLRGVLQRHPRERFQRGGEGLASSRS
jgi:hypothetical protein